MTKIDIISGFLGAGKTTLIKKLIKESLHKENIVLIENEFGEIGIDGGFLQDAGIEVREMNSGCICCSLVGDFSQALEKVIEEYHPDRIVIEPSGVGKLSDVIKAVQDIHHHDLTINSLTTVADANKCKMYMKNFGEFFNNQIEHANVVVLSRTQGMSAEKLHSVVHEIKEHNEDAQVITTPWDSLSGDDILSLMEHPVSLKDELIKEVATCPTCGHIHEHHHHHEHNHNHEECECGHHHEHDHNHEECECEHHEHEHNHEECECGHHEHNHNHEECGCGHHEHDHNHEECGCGHHDHHHADEVFTSWGSETPRKYTREELEAILKELANENVYGTILRAKGMLENIDGTWMYFDLVPEEYEIREGNPTYTGRFCVIGSKLDTKRLQGLFQVA